MEVKAFKKTITAAANVTADDTSQVVYVFALPPDCYILGLFARVKTAFSGVTSPKVKLGVSGHTDLYIREQRIGKVGDLVCGSSVAAVGVCTVQPLGAQASGTGQRDVFATFTSASGNLSSLSAGEIDFVVVYAE